MKSTFTALVLTLLLALPALAQDPAPAAAPSGGAPIPIPDPPELPVKSYLLVDHNSGTVLAEHNADERLEPASLTKIMAAYVVFRELAAGHLSLDDEALISEKAWRTGGSKMFVKVGDRVSVRDLLMGVIVQSGNDASVALAEHIAGSEATFAELMNTHAKRLGMSGSHFVNSDGLPDPELYSTARDMALVTAATIREFPEYYAWYAEKEFTYNGISQRNRNALLHSDENVDGVKTGHTEAAGYCLVASGVRDGMRLTSVVFGANSVKARAEASRALLNYGFRFYETHQLYAGGKPVETLRVWRGSATELPVGPAEDLWVTIPRRQYDKLAARIEKRPEIRAPVARGETVGEIAVTLDGKDLRRVPLVALGDVGEGGLWEKARDGVLKWF
jgi:serine-type D-Ala-D-Ala carboxypeptidase (penicillin-binding protein 5/6)